MFNLISADLYKLRKSTALKILFGITTVCAILMTLFAYLIPQGKLEESMTGMGFLFSDMNVMSILGAVMAGVIICGDYENKIIQDSISTGYSRSTIIISKSIAYFLALTFLLLPYVLITGIAIGSGNEFSMGAVAIGFNHLLTIEAGNITAAAIGKLLAVMLTLLIVYLGQLCICIPLAFLLKKPVLVVAITYVFSILSAQLIRIAESSPAFNRFFSLTPYGGRYIFLTTGSEAGEILKAIMVSLVFATIMITITYFFFRKSEMK